MFHRTYAVIATALLLVGSAALIADDNVGKDNNNDMRLKTRLAGAAIAGKTPEGSADFRADSRSRTRLNVEVENVNLPVGTTLTVTFLHPGAAAVTLGTIKLSALGESELELNSDDGAVVPAVKSGDIVTVSNAGKTILAGVF